MDTLSRYYLIKANLKSSDAFYSHIEASDIDALNNAFGYMFICPVGTFFFIYALKSIQENGGMANNFRGWANMARQWQGSPQNTATWDGTDLKYKEPEVQPEANTQANQKTQQEQQQPVQPQKVAELNRSNARSVRNTNPFERKKRLAMGERLHSTLLEDFQKHGAAKITKAGEDQTTRGANPSEYIRASEKIYQEEFLTSQGKDVIHQKLHQHSLGGMKNHSNIEQNQAHVIAPKAQQWLKTRQFGNVLTRFAQLRQSSSAERRFRFMIYAVPVTFTTIGAMSNFFQQSLTIYLRYQAMVDESYHRRLNQSVQVVPQQTIKATGSDSEKLGSILAEVQVSSQKA